MITDYQWIDDVSDLDELILSIKKSDEIAFDSEFERTNTYFSKPALFQLCINSSFYLIDMKNITDYQVFVKLLDNIILHSGSEDLEILYNLNQKLPSTIFDTQIAASLCGYGLHFSYQNIVKELLGVELSKAHSRSDWMQRPLKPEQIQYALEDVLYLTELKSILMQKLQDLGRVSWHQELMQQKVNSIMYSKHIDATFIKLSKSKNFNIAQQKLLYALLNWREKTAIKRNKPRPWILKNHEIVDIILMQPDTDETLMSKIGLYPKFVEYNAQSIIDLYENSQNIAELTIPKFDKLTTQQGALMAQMKQLLTQKCEQLNIPTALIINTANLKSLVAAGKNLDNIDMWQLITNE